MLEARLLGTFDLRCDGQVIALASRPAQSLLAYLLLHAGVAHRREKLAGLFWPDSVEEKARTNLRHELWRIRKALQAAHVAAPIIADELTITFDATCEYRLDARELEQIGANASIIQLMEGLTAYRGELLPGFYEEWVVTERERLQFVFEQRIARLLELLEAEKRWGEMVEWAERWISAGENPDAAYRCLMVAYSALKDRAKVLATYERYVRALQQLGLEPAEDVRALAEVKEAQVELPTPITRLIGRTREQKDIGELLGIARLVTLTGSGGVGKTRLAIEVARDMAGGFPDGVCYLELASIEEASVLPDRLLTLMKIPPAKGQRQSAMDRLTSHLRSRHALVVLDNCERLIEACAQLASALLTACPRVRILATSREPFRIPAETAYRVPSLAVPSADDLLSLDCVAQIDSVRLFVERARGRSPGYTLTRENAQLVGQICIRLDGIPLAIELAACRLDALPLEGIVEHLDERFALLTGGLRTDIPRHKTLRALIDWSYDLLTEPERVLLRRLSVFAGGWTLEAAQGVTVGGVLRKDDVMKWLPELVDKSLVVLDSATGRYRMLETIREYCVDRLEETSEAAAFRMRHLDHYLALAEAADAAAREGEALNAQLALERDNLIAAVQWCAHVEDGVQKGLQLLGAARLTWLIIDLEMGYRLTHQFLSLPGAEPRNYHRCRALLTFVQTSYFAGHGRDLEATAEALAIAREIGDRRRESQALDLYGAFVAQSGNPKEGLRCLEQALRIATELGLARLANMILSDMADVLRASGELAAAEGLLEQAIAAQRQRNTPQELIASLLSATSVAMQRGEFAAARTRLLEALRIMSEVPLGMRDAGPPLLLSGCFLAAAEKWRQAAVLFGAAERQREAANRILESSEELFSAPFMQRTREQMGEAEYRTAWAGGRRLAASDVVGAARDWLAEQG